MDIVREPPERSPGMQPLLLAGLGAVSVAFVWNLAAPATGAALRAGVIALGLLAVACVLAVQIPREGALTAAWLWAIGAGASLAGRNSLASDWDSIGLLFGILTGVCVLGALIAAVPPNWRRFLASLLILFHFGAVFCAITVVPTTAGPPPFLSVQAYVRLFHQYLIATNLNNGYHFYAPEPGPCALVWFRVQWDDGASAWLRIPDHGKVANHLERRRMGALATILSNTEPLRGPDADSLAQARVDEGMKHKPPIPVADLPMHAQYREPSAIGKLLLASYVRHVARTFPHPKGTTAKVVGIKVYMVEYWNPPVEHFQAGQPPLDPTLYAAYYAGEFDADGKLKMGPAWFAPEKQKDGQVVPVMKGGDPYLYWRLPITRLESLPQPPKPGEPPRVEAPKGGEWTGEGRVINFVRIHAGDGDEEAVP